MSDQLKIVGIECFGHHGVFPDEKRAGQPFIVDLTIGLDTRPAAATDDLAKTVDYGSLVLAVKAAVERDPVDLIETVAERIAQVCLAGDLVESITVDLHKPLAPIKAAFSDVVISIRRDRSDRQPTAQDARPLGNRLGPGVNA